jgi:peptidoglycan-N-acetylglucosamine deacetylase
LKAKRITLCAWLALLFVFGVYGWAGSTYFDPAEKTIYLTFDDGPRPVFLRQILPLLEQYGASASFFVIGAEAAGHPELIREVSRRHTVENHSWGHENFKKLMRDKGEAAVIRNLDRAAALIEDITGRKPKFFRPPCWEIDSRTKAVIAGRGYTVMELGNPDINTMDYDDYAHKRSASVLVEKVKKMIDRRERSGQYKHVLVFHELPITAEALKELIPYFSDKGYAFRNLNDFPGSGGGENK